MNTREFYTKYAVPSNLQEHMLRVAALAQIILDSWRGSAVDKDAIVTACLFHDVAKPMNFDLAKQSQFGTPPEEIAKLAELQKRLRDLYGSDEHHATVAVCQEIGLSPAAVKCVNDLEWKFIPRLLKDGEIESLIPIYCDMRIGPKGILLLDERLSELRRRVGEKEYQDNVQNGKSLENIIRHNTKIDLELITDEQLNSRFQNLANLEIPA